MCRRHRGRGDGSAPATTSGVAATTCFSLPPSRWRQLSLDRNSSRFVYIYFNAGWNPLKTDLPDYIYIYISLSIFTISLKMFSAELICNVEKWKRYFNCVI